MKVQSFSGSSSPKFPRQGGLTMLEVLIALIFVSVAAAALILSSNTSLLGNERSRTYGGATMATIEALDAVKLMSLDEIKLLSETGLEHSQGGDVTVKVTARDVGEDDVSELSSLNPTTLQHVTFSTAFKNKEGEDVIKTFTTFVYKPE